MKRTMPAVLILVSLLLIAIFSSCAEINKPPIGDEKSSHLEQAFEKTMKNMESEMPFLKTFEKALKNGLVSLRLEASEGKEAIRFTVYVDDTDLAVVLGSTQHGEDTDIALYAIGEGVTFDFSQIPVPGATAFYLPASLLKTALTPAGSIIPTYDGDDVPYAPGYGLSMSGMVLALLTGEAEDLINDFVSLIPYEVTEETLKVGGKDVRCDVTTYTLNEESLQNAVTGYMTSALQNAMQSAGISPDLDIFDMSQIGGFHFDMEGEIKFAVSKKSGFVVLESLSARHTGAGGAEKFSLDVEIDLGENASLYGSKSIKVNLVQDGEEITADAAWQLENSEDAVTGNLDVALKMATRSAGLKTDVEIDLLDMNFNLDKQSGDFTLSAGSEYLAMFLHDTGLIPSTDSQLFRIKGNVTCQDDAFELYLSEIAVYGEVEPVSLRLQIAASPPGVSALPQAPKAETVESLEELGRLFETSGMPPFLESIFGNIVNWGAYEPVEWEFSFDFSGF